MEEAMSMTEEAMAEEGAVSEPEKAVVRKETMSKTEEIGAKPNINNSKGEPGLGKEVVARLKHEAMLAMTAHASFKEH